MVSQLARSSGFYQIRNASSFRGGEADSQVRLSQSGYRALSQSTDEPLDGVRSALAADNADCLLHCCSLWGDGEFGSARFAWDAVVLSAGQLRRLNPSDWMYQPNVCNSCAEKNLGVVY